MKSEVGYNCREITFANLDLLAKESEAIFALACLEAGCRLIAQIPVHGSIIDFMVINPKNPRSTGKLVEVSTLPRSAIEGPPASQPSHKVQLQIASKRHQIENMRASGLPWTVLFGREIANLKKVSGDPRE